MTGEAVGDHTTWIEATHESISYRFQVVGEDELQLTETSQDARVGAEPPEPVQERLAPIVSGFDSPRGRRRARSTIRNAAYGEHTATRTLLPAPGPFESVNERPSPDQRVAFERDDHTCLRCESQGEESDLVGYHVLDGVAASADYEPETASGDQQPLAESLATICADCHDLLEGAPPAWYRRLERDPAGGVLGMLRTVTTEQGSAVARVADFAAAATGGVDADEPDDRRRYLDDWRGVRVELAAVDRQLAAVEAVDASALPDAAEQALDPVRTLTSDLQAHLESVLHLAETAIAADGRCHACLGELDGSSRCPACATAVRETSEWETDDGSVALAELYGAVNERLGRASATTGQLTDRTGELAELLVERQGS